MRKHLTFHLKSDSFIGRLARIIHNQWIIRATLMTCLHKPVYTQGDPDFRFETWSWFESEYVKAYRGLGGLAPKVAGFRE